MIIIGLIVFFGCKKEENTVNLKTNNVAKKDTLPTLITQKIFNITYTSAVSGGIIISDGGDSIIEKGVCWSTSQQPTINDNKTVDGYGVGSFISFINNLTKDTKYYVRAYAKNKIGVGYGEEQEFYTLSDIVPPFVTTIMVYDIKSFSAKVKSKVISNGGENLYERGICWDTVANPDINDNKLSSGNDTGVFVIEIDSLKPNTKYYVKSYAINSKGVSYGNELMFSTIDAPQYVVCNDTFFISIYNQTIQWYNDSYDSTGAVSKSDGTSNTDIIVQKQGNGSYAALICKKLSDYGYNDWFLPSEDELFCIYQNKDNISGISFINYWSSTEFDVNNAVTINFYTGNKENNTKNTANGVICIKRKKK